MIKYKITEVNPTAHSIVVRYFTEVITEKSLATQVGAEGEILRGCTDYSIDMPVPMPNAEELQRIILAAAPKKWLETQETVFLNGPSPALVALTAQLNLLQGELPLTLVERKVKFAAQVKLEAGIFTQQVLSGLGSEYELAEKEATDYKAAGYPETPIPGSVQSEINSKAAKGIAATATVAADTILKAATQWRAAQAAIRDKRLSVASSAEVTIDAAGLDTIKAQWAEFMTALKSQLVA